MVDTALFMHIAWVHEQTGEQKIPFSTTNIFQDEKAKKIYV